MDKIIHSLLDVDFYKFTMGQLVFHQYPDTVVKYRFVCRNKEINLLPYKEEIQEEINNLKNLLFLPEEIDFLRQQKVFQEDYLKYLTNFRPNIGLIKIEEIDQNLSITVEGPWRDTILFEIYLLSIVNEVYFRSQSKLSPVDISIGQVRLEQKIESIKANNKLNISKFKLAEFGTRRRFSLNWHNHVVSVLKKELPDNLVGTSNVYFAMKHKLKPIGTTAHEIFQAFQVLSPDLKDFQRFALDKWLNEYQQKLSIALTDVISTPSFLRDFNQALTEAYQGLRHDSGDPHLWMKQVLTHYKSHGVEVKNKTLVFSDGLDVPRAIDLHNKYYDQANLLFGIGTNLTNDVGYKPLNIVMKLVLVNDQPVAKISDEPTKAICDDPRFLNQLRQVFHV